MHAEVPRVGGGGSRARRTVAAELLAMVVAPVIVNAVEQQLPLSSSIATKVMLSYDMLSAA